MSTLLFSIIGVLSATIITAATSAWLATQWLRPKPIPGIPHAPVTSFWGDFAKMCLDWYRIGGTLEPGGCVWTAIHEMGPIFQLIIGPWTNYVVVTDVQAFEEALLRKSKSFEQSPVTMLSFVGFIPYGMPSLKTDDIWRRHRRAIAPMTSPAFLEQLAPTMGANARLLVKYWSKKASATKEDGGLCFSVQNDLEYATLDTLTAVIVGKSINSLSSANFDVDTVRPIIDTNGGATFDFFENDEYCALRYLFTQVGELVSQPLFLTKFWTFVLNFRPRYMMEYGLIIGYIDEQIEKRKREVREARAEGLDPAPARSMLGLLVETEDLAEYETLSMREMEDEALAFLFSVRSFGLLHPPHLTLQYRLQGHDTTSKALSWGLKFLTEAPDVQHSLLVELLSALDDNPESRPLTYADVMSDRTPLLEAVVAEILRCGMVSSGLSRITIEPVTILGKQIPANTQIHFLASIGCKSATKSRLGPTAAPGDHGLWEDSDVECFNPARWLEHDYMNGGVKFNPKAGYSFPFGLGARSCAGQQLAVLELKIYIATLTLAFFFEKVPPALGGLKGQKRVTRGPQVTYVAPSPWNRHA